MRIDWAVIWISDAMLLGPLIACLVARTVTGAEVPVECKRGLADKEHLLMGGSEAGTVLGVGVASTTRAWDGGSVVSAETATKAFASRRVSPLAFLFVRNTLCIINPRSPGLYVDGGQKARKSGGMAMAATFVG